MEEYIQVIGKYVILYKGQEHLWILVYLVS